MEEEQVIIAHMRGQAQTSNESSDLHADEQVCEREKDSYEPPRLDVIGRFEELTLGAGGSRGDGAVGQTRI